MAKLAPNSGAFMVWAVISTAYRINANGRDWSRPIAFIFCFNVIGMDQRVISFPRRRVR